MRKTVCLFTLLLVITWHTAHGEEFPALSQGQTLCAPAYSHIYVGNREKPFLLTVTLHVRNVDLKHPITVKSVDYYDSRGNLLKKYLARPLTLKPLESSRHIVPQNEKKGGAGANFIVVWSADKAVNQPIVETVMIGAESQQGISFTSRGQVIDTSN